MSGGSRGPNTYQFRVGDAAPSQAIVEAVAYVTGKDPTDVEPLCEVVDPDGLNDLVDREEACSIVFQMEGVEVTVTSAEEIVVEDSRDPATLHDRLDGATSVLLLAPSAADEACMELLAVAPYEQENVLSIAFSQSAYERLQAWETHTTAVPAAGAIVSMGEFTRSTAAGSGSGVSARPFSVETVEDATDLTTLGIRVNRQLTRWADNGNRTVACVHSLTDLLTLVDDETACGFLDVLADRFESAGVVAHYHMDPTEHDDETVAEFRARFDAVVELDESGDRDVRVH